MSPTSVLIKREEDRDAQREPHVTTKAEAGVMQLQDKEAMDCWPRQKPGRGEKGSDQCLKGNVAL